jgi:hypothetical protein
VTLLSAIEAGPVQVGRNEHGVSISHGSGGPSWDVLDLEQARELVRVLDRAMADDAPDGLIGSVAMLNGRHVYVTRWPAAVSLRVRVDHSGVTLSMIEQVRALRDAIDSECAAMACV